MALINLRSWKNFNIIWERMIKNVKEFAMQKKRMLYPKYDLNKHKSLYEFRIIYSM
jgi:hypothetical protein